MAARPRALLLYRERLSAVREKTAAAVATAARQSPEAGARAAYHAIDALFHSGEAGAKVACRAGCSWCCHVNVDATVPELRSIAAHVLHHFTDAEQRALVERLAARVLPGGAPADQERWAARLPCALLDGTGRCSVYDVRPLRCRTFHSTDDAACRAAFDGDPSAEPATDATLARLFDAVESGYDDALGARNPGGTSLERSLLELLVTTTGATP